MIGQQKIKSGFSANRTAAWIVGVLFLIVCSITANAQNLQKIRFANAAAALTALAADKMIAEYLGYYRAEGLTVEHVSLGSTAAVSAAFANKRIEFAYTSPQLALMLASKGEQVPSINFFEGHYPFRFMLGVLPNSPIKEYANLKNKTIGVPNFGTQEYLMARVVIKSLGLDPDKDVVWLVLGEGGVTAARALQRGDVDALYYNDIGFGQVEAVGLSVRYLAQPEGVPNVGGYYIATTPELLRDHRAWAVGVARGVAKAQIFIQENPEAASYIFGLMAPETLPKGKSVEEQVRATMFSVTHRMQFYTPYDKSVLKGFTKESEWLDEVAFGGFGGKIKDMSQFYTNDLIKEINDFDVEKIKAEARAFKLPYKNK